MKANKYLTHIEEKKECLNNMTDMANKLRMDTLEYKNLEKQYFSLLMLDVSRGNSLSQVERNYIAKNIHLLDKYPRATRESLRESLMSMGVIDRPEVEKVEEDSKAEPKEKVEYKTFAELYPETDGNRAVEKIVKRLKDSYVYLKPAIKMCDKLIDYIHTLRFVVSTPVKAKDDECMSR